MRYDFNDTDLKKAARQAEKYYLNILPTNAEISHRFSSKFEKKVNRLIKKTQRGNYRPLSARRRFVVITVCLCIMFASSMSISAVRTTVLEFVTNVYEKYTEIFFSNSGAVTNDDFEMFLPKYIPDDFEIVDEDLSDYVFLEYSDGKDYIIYEQQFIGVTSHINIEGAELEETVMNGNNATYYSNQGIQNLLWYDDTYLYRISSTLSKDEVFTIAESVQ